MINLADEAMTIKLDYDLPEYPKMESCYRRAPRRESHLTEADKALAIKNALRYIHPDHHEQMAKEFAQELEEHGRIYGYRFRPEGKLYGKPIDESTVYDPHKPFEHRDPRCTYTIVEHGTQHLGVIFDPHFDRDKVYSSREGAEVVNNDSLSYKIQGT